MILDVNYTVISLGSFNYGLRWKENHCGICNKECEDLTNFYGFQSCSCDEMFCYPDCFKAHQKSTGHRT